MRANLATVTARPKLLFKKQKQQKADVRKEAEDNAVTMGMR